MLNCNEKYKTTLSELVILSWELIKFITDYDIYNQVGLVCSPPLSNELNHITTTLKVHTC